MDGTWELVVEEIAKSANNGPRSVESSLRVEGSGSRILFGHIDGLRIRRGSSLYAVLRNKISWKSVTTCVVCTFGIAATLPFGNTSTIYDQKYIVNIPIGSTGCETRRCVFSI